MAQDQSEEDILLKLTMPGKSLRETTNKQEKTEEQQPLTATLEQGEDTKQEASQQEQQEVSQQHNAQQEKEEQQKGGIVPPANTPPKEAEAQEDILRKLTMKLKEQDIVIPEMSQEVRPPPGMIYQSPEEAQSNKPYVSRETEIEKVRKIARNIYSTDLVEKRLKKK